MAAHQIATEGTSQEILALSQAIADYLQVGGTERWGLCVHKNESDPEKRCSYLGAARGMRAAHMNFSSGEFEFGDWGDMWFVTGNKPLMLKSDRTVDYYLDPDDLSKKVDGTASDIADSSYDGNAMAQIPLVYLDQYESAGCEYLWVCKTKYNSNYEAYAHTREDGSIADYFYWSIFGGSLVDGKLRSISGLSLQQSATAATQIEEAEANGEGWYIHTHSQRNLIQCLLALMCCNDNTQESYGYGNCCSASSASSMKTTGTLNAKGSFWGTNANSSTQVKVFNIEKFWGDQWDRTAGLMNNSEGILVKMTPPYNLTGEGYVRTGIKMSGTSGGYISKTNMSKYGRLPVIVSGSSNTYVCDAAWFNNGQLDMALCGAGAVNAAAVGGAWTVDLALAPGCTYWDYGAGLSCEQPAAQAA